MSEVLHALSENALLSESGKKISAGIVGGAGYTGGELIRLLINHPEVNIAFIHSKSNAGKPVSNVHADLLGDTELAFSSDMNGTIDVLFLCLGHGDARKFLEANPSLASTNIIDLSHDYRLSEKAVFGNGKFVYGLPELNKKNIQSAQYVANPGCFATALQLGLLPLASSGMLKEVHSTGITGSTGAGQSLSATTHFSWRTNNISAYKTLTHQHLKEVGQSLQQLQPSFSSAEENLYFVPWRGDFARGIYISSIISTDTSIEALNDLYTTFYQDAPFTHLSPAMIDLKQVVNTNKCLLFVEKVGNKMVVHAAIDNLLKGASGQAVQNMNLMFGLDEKTGLRLKGAGF